MYKQKYRDIGMNKYDFIKSSLKIFGKKYDYSLVPNKFKTKDFVKILYKNIPFNQRASDHLIGKFPETSRIRNTQDFINKSKLIWGDKYDYSLCEFINSRKKVKIIYKSKVYNQTPTNHLKGFKCENLWDTEKFIIESKKIFKNKYDYSLTEFKNFHYPVKIIYNREVYKQKPIHHLRGNNVENSNKTKKLNKSDFIKRSKDIFGDRYDYSKVKYVNMETNVDILFNGVLYKQKPKDHLNGLKPEGINVVDTKSFIDKSKKIHKNRYDYSLTNYVDSNKPVKILYKGVLYLQKPYQHLLGYRPENKNVKKTTKEFIDISNLIHDFRYSYEKSKYNNSLSKVIITCPIHGHFNKTANSHLQGYGCPKCDFSKKKEISKFLNKNNISYYTEYKFIDCRNLEYCLPFDFYLPKARTVIEFYSKQHFEPVEIFGGIKAYQSIKLNDGIKDEYCEENYINIIKIRYDQLNIKKILFDNLKNYI